MEGKRHTAYFYGDSNTYGYDPRGLLGGRYPAEHRWADVLAEDLKDSWMILANGMNGRQIPASDFDYTVFERSLRKAETAFREAGLGFDLFAVMLGTNDYEYMWGPNVPAVTERMEKFLLYLKAQPTLAETRILLIAPPLLLERDLFTESYRALAEKHGTDFMSAAELRPEMAFDGEHLTERGSLEFAGHLKDYLCTISL